MAIDAIKQVTGAEQAAEDMLQAANAEAKRIVAEAQRSGKQAVDDAVHGADQQVRELMRQAEDKSASTAMEITAQAESECEKLRILAKGRMKQASALIVERVVNS